MSKENRVSDDRLDQLEAIIHELAGEVAPGGPEDRAWAIINDLSSKPVAGVEVKPLEWVGDEAQTPFGKYRVYRTDDGYGVSFEHDELVHVGFNSVRTFESPRDNAISYAQPDYRQRILSTLSRPAQEPAHPDDMAVDRFAVAMKDKLKFAREHRGRGGWEDKEQCGQHYLSELLRGHVEKGDPVDVANFCMMLQQRGERITK